jgi:hypothetical protein
MFLIISTGGVVDGIAVNVGLAKGLSVVGVVAGVDGTKPGAQEAIAAAAVPRPTVRRNFLRVNVNSDI